MLSKKTAIFLLFIALLPGIALGAPASGTVPSSGASSPASGINDSGFLDWINFIYSFMLSAAAILAVLMLVLAGIQMMTAVEKWRTDAKQRVWNAFMGLALAALSFLILKTINPQLINLQIKPPAIRIEGQAAPGLITPTSSERGWCKATTGFCSMQPRAACTAIGTFFGANKPNDCKNP